MTVTPEFVSALPDPDAFETLMLEYYTIMASKLSDAGGPQLSAADLARDTLTHMQELLPPDGRTLLAHDEAGRLIGCGVLRKVRPNAAELKRMFVRPEAQGLGLGRKLFEMRIDAAREMGCTTLYADTVKGNRAMLAMYERLGFDYIPRYPENANPPELDPYLVYLERHLT
ncbi:GNAT family N-acetyltransferase [uncultured Shimia sp.]|uniref:GNAT family N-acetyltransferase n=1 Tax=uncultured Shimia sp. TaxID=573152 RepID=UPI0025FC3407|nr:GNAT family N-acetyltransferase [uncultured Shimia sp.]